MSKTPSDAEKPFIPIVPQWNIFHGCVCTPDGGFLYVGSRTINYIGKVHEDTKISPENMVLHSKQPIYGIDFDPAWSKPCSKQYDEKSDTKILNRRRFVASTQDNSIQLWDLDLGICISGHRAHVSTHFVEGGTPIPHSSERVVIGFMHNRNLLSMDCNSIVVYCTISNTYFRRRNFIPMRNNFFSSLCCSPYNENIFAAGTQRGIVIVGDLKSSTVQYSLKAHDASITGLSWILVPCSKEQLPKNEETEKSPEKYDIKKNEEEEIFDIYNYDDLENEFGTPIETEKKIPKDSNIDNYFVGIEKPKSVVTFDYVEECDNLKGMINTTKDSSFSVEITLDECQEAKKNLSAKLSDDSSYNSNNSSLECIEIEGEGRKPKQQILHKAEVHATQTLERKSLSPVRSDKDKDKENKPLNSRKQCQVDVEKAKLLIHNALGKPTATANNPFKKAAQILDDILLATAAIDGSYSIWNAETGIIYDTIKSRPHGKNNLVQIGWLDSKTFLTTNNFGDITSWKVMPRSDDKKTNQNYKFKMQKTCRFAFRGVVSFGISMSDQCLWSITYNREIGCESLITGKVLGKWVAASTNINNIRESPDDMNKIGVTMLDRRLSILDCSSLSPLNVKLENFTQYIEHLVTICWSPDGLKLAFGSYEGRLGFVDVESSKHATVTFKPAYAAPIYCINWHEDYIYIVCKESVITYNSHNPKADGYVLGNIKSASTISLRDKYLFVGTQHGLLQLLRRRSTSSKFPIDYELLQTVHVNIRYITEISWSSVNVSRMAVATSSNCIQLYNFDQEKAQIHHTLKFDLENIKAGFPCVRWSFYNDYTLITACLDGFIRIWDIRSGKNVLIFNKNFHCPMFTCMFMPCNENYILCAGKSTSLEIIDIRYEKSDEETTGKSKIKNPFSDSLNNIKWAISASMNLSEKKRSEFRKNNESDMMKNVKVNDVRKQHKNSICEENKDEKKIANEIKIAEDLPESNTQNTFSNKSDVHRNEVFSFNSRDENQELLTSEMTELKLLDRIESVAESMEAENVSVNEVLMKHCDADILSEANEAIIYKNDEQIEMNDQNKCLKRQSAVVEEYKRSSPFMHKNPTLLFLTTRELNKRSLPMIKSILETGTNRDSSYLEKLFGTKKEALELLNNEWENYQQSNAIGAGSILLPLFHTSLKDEIIQCIAKKQLNEWHVSIAPTISYTFWKKCCEAFAEQLLEQGYILQAATYMIAVKKNYECIKFLCEKKYYKEALLLGRIYLNAEDPYIQTLIDEWCSELLNQGNLYSAAYLYMVQNNMELAYESLMRQRSKPEELKEVIDIMKLKLDGKELKDGIADKHADPSLNDLENKFKMLNIENNDYNKIEVENVVDEKCSEKDLTKGNTEEVIKNESIEKVNKVNEKNMKTNNE